MGQYEKQATAFCNVIRAFAKNPEGLENLEMYLSHHFAGWLEHMANTPESITEELSSFVTGIELPF